MFAEVVQVSPHTLIQRTRRLPLEGRVLVSLGDAVQPQDVIAEAMLPAGAVTLDLCQGLGLPEAEVEACVVCKPGDILEAGDLIAQSEGKLTRLVSAPADGALLEINRGKAVLATGTTLVQVRAGLIGFVMDVFPGSGALLRAEGGLVQGVWGNGHCGAGALSLPTASLAEDSESDGSYAAGLSTGDLLAVECCETDKWFETAAKVGLGGLICGTLAPELIPLAAAWERPVIVLQGFEPQPLDLVTWELLTSQVGEVASLDARPVDLWQGLRPEVVIPRQGASEPEAALPFQARLAAGQRVRILAGPAVGRTGKLVSLGEETVFESGLRCKTATVKLREGDRLTVPQQNLAILG